MKDSGYNNTEDFEIERTALDGNSFGIRRIDFHEFLARILKPRRYYFLLAVLEVPLRPEEQMKIPAKKAVY